MGQRANAARENIAHETRFGRLSDRIERRSFSTRNIFPQGCASSRKVSGTAARKTRRLPAKRDHRGKGGKCTPPNRITQNHCRKQLRLAQHITDRFSPALVLVPFLMGLAGCTTKTPTLKQVAAPTISSFSASPASIINGSTATASWAARPGQPAWPLRQGHLHRLPASGYRGFEPDGDHHVHADSDQHHGFCNRDTDGDGDAADSADDQLVHGQPNEHHAGRNQRTLELDNFRRDDAEYCAGQPGVDRTATGSVNVSLKRRP